jgi:hypothetical protein
MPSSLRPPKSLDVKITEQRSRRTTLKEQRGTPLNVGRRIALRPQTYFVEVAHPINLGG